MVDPTDTVNTVVSGLVAVKMIETGGKLLNKTKPKKSKMKVKGLFDF